MNNHAQAIAHYEEEIEAMETGNLRHYGNGAADDQTARMLSVAKESKGLHKRCLALGVGEGATPLVVSHL